MPVCHVCGESKPQGEFHHVTNFTKYKKHPVTWCRDCQKLWMDMRKEKERLEKLMKAEKKFYVDFE